MGYLWSMEAEIARFVLDLYRHNVFFRSILDDGLEKIRRERKQEEGTQR